MPDPQHSSTEHGAGEASAKPSTDTAPGTDTAAIHQLIARAKLRIRSQWALEGATTAVILASAAALAAVFAIRIELVSPAVGVALIAGAAAIVVVGAVLSAMRAIDDERVARRIDRASNLSDRLSTAVAFSRSAQAGDSDVTQDLMRAAIRDGVRAVPRADVVRATPFTRPADLRPALGFLAIAALAAGLAIPTVDRAPHLYLAEPDHGAGGDEIVLRGANLFAGLAHPIAAIPTPTRNTLAAAGAPDAATAPPAPATHGGHGYVPSDAIVALGAGKAHPVTVLDWSVDHILVRIPDDAAIGATTLTAWIGDTAVGPIAFTVVDRRDPRYHKADSVVLEPDDRAYLEALLAEIKAVAKRDDVPELEDFAKQVEQLIQDAELGKISKEKLLEALAKAEDKLQQQAEPDQKAIDQELADLGKQLAKDQVTKELGDALQKTDLDKAKQELEKLAEKLDKNQLSDKDKDQLAKQLEKVAKQLDDKEQKNQTKQQQQHQKLEEEIRRLEKKKKDAKTEQEQLETERQLNKKKDELKQLEKDEQDRDESAQRQALKRLARDMDKASKDLQKNPDKDKQDKQDQKDQDKDGQQQGQQASQKLKDAARETGRVDQDRRKQATQKKMSSQMEDLREAMRRAKQKGGNQGKDPFGKQGKNQDFAQRARGQRGQSSAWKPGQGQGQNGGQGQGGQGQGGQGQQGGKEWGVGHDDNLVGDPTQKSGNTKDDDLQGKQGSQGGGTRETILAAAQKGFASQRYRDVYGQYRKVIEEVMRTEKLPSSYKSYVKRYFAKIHPSMESGGGDAPADPSASQTTSPQASPQPTSPPSTATSEDKSR